MIDLCPLSSITHSSQSENGTFEQEKTHFLNWYHEDSYTHCSKQNNELKFKKTPIKLKNESNFKSNKSSY